MGLQLIICVEANKKSKSDWIYIKETLEHYFLIDNVNFKLSPIFLGSKTRFNDDSILHNIRNLTNQFSSTSAENSTKVIFAVDVDNIDTSSEDNQRWKSINSFCDENKYELVWFYKDIELVYLKQKVSDNEKKKFAEMFKRKGLINSVKKCDLNCLTFKNNTSNIINILSKYLKAK